MTIGAPHESIRTGSTTTPFILCTSSHIYTMAQTSNPKGRNLIAVIGDEVSISSCDLRPQLMGEDSVTGLLLAGIGHVDNQQKKNFLIVDSSTSHSIYLSLRTDEVETQTNVIESAFQDYTERKDIAILLINQHVSHHSLYA